MRRVQTVLVLIIGLSGNAGAAQPPFDLQGHRGARGLMPENTLPAFAQALRIGVTTLELDLAVTRDGVLVVSHDLRLDPDLTRAADGQWIEWPGPSILALDLEQLHTYDVGRIRPGSRHAGRFPARAQLEGVRVPALAEVVALTRQASARQVRFNIETKISPHAPDLAPSATAFARHVVEAVRAQDIVRRTTVQSFDWRTLRAVRGLEPALETACLTVEQDWMDNLEQGEAGASPWLGGLDADAFAGVPELVHAAGCRVWSPYWGDLDQASAAPTTSGCGWWSGRSTTRRRRPGWSRTASTASSPTTPTASGACSRAPAGLCRRPARYRLEPQPPAL
jgi:glycerophosphoryl diester phosphodiesterase